MSTFAQVMVWGQLAMVFMSPLAAGLLIALLVVAKHRRKGI